MRAFWRCQRPYRRRIKRSRSLCFQILATKQPSKIDELRPEVRSLFERLIAAQKLTLKEALADDHYRQLAEFRFYEPVRSNSLGNKPIWDYLHTNGRVGIRFRNSAWWQKFNEFFEETPGGE